MAADAKMIRLFEIGRTLQDAQLESRDDELLEDLGAELVEMSGICHVCEGSGDDEDDPCPNCGGSGLERK